MDFAKTAVTSVMSSDYSFSEMDTGSRDLVRYRPCAAEVAEDLAITALGRIGRWRLEPGFFHAVSKAASCET